MQKPSKLAQIPQIRFAGFTDPWERRKLSEICQYRSSSLTAKDISDDGNYDLYDANSIIGKTNKEYMKTDYITIIKDGAGVGRTRLLPKNSMFLGTMGALTSQNSDLNFLYQLITNANLSKEYSGSTIPHIYFKNYGENKYYISSLQEQQKIGELFANLDNLITLHQRKCDTLKKVKKSMLQKMFPKNGESVPEIRFAGFTEDWEQRKFGEVAKFINGRAYSQDELLSKGKYKVLRVGNFYTNDSWYYSDMELEDKFYAQKGDLLYTWSATFGPHIWCGDKIIYHYHIWKIELSYALDKSFAVQLLEQDKQSILSDKNGSTMVHITKVGMEEKNILLPISLVEQAKIGTYFQNLDNLITLQQRKVEKLKNIKKALLNKMLI